MINPDSKAKQDAQARADQRSIASRFAQMGVDDLPQIQEILEFIGSRIECPSAMLSMIEDGHHRIIASFGLEAGDIATAERCAGLAGDDSELFVIEDIAALKGFSPPTASADHSNLRFYVGLPLSVKGSGLLGILSIFDRRPRTVTQRARHAVSNAQLIVNSLLASYEAKKIAQESQDELHITMENMDQGLTVFDADAKMTLWNQRFIDIFEKSPDDIYRGVSLKELVEKQDLKNGFEGFEGGFEEMLAALRAGLARGEIVPGGVRLNSGRIISSVHAAMPNGGWVSTHSDITERVRAQEKIEHASLHDSQTGLGNRAKFTCQFESMAADTSKRIAVILIDIDEFKQVNDSFGHAGGDAVIVCVAERLTECVRDDDIVVRLGGDEFAVLLQIDAEDDDDTVPTIA
ncbi:MAG: diguanylate cyclase [Hyphomicrobiales bacterium]